jgi:putative FmdB family regulatory protein
MWEGYKRQSGDIQAGFTVEDVRELRRPSLEGQALQRITAGGGWALVHPMLFSSAVFRYILLPEVLAVPLYEYVCKRCFHPFEELSSHTDVASCPKCAATDAERVPFARGGR